MSLEGSQLGHYRLQRLIGSGSMSEIYLAQDTHIPRQVAVKVLRTTKEVSSDSSTAQEAERLFEREMQAVSLLDHPHILPLFDYGTEQSDTITRSYLVMPYRPEGSLRDWLLRQESTILLNPYKIIHILLQAADALQHAHERHILHQDIKPDNFLIRIRNSTADTPDILLTDFGLAKFTDTSSFASQSVRGTPIYMPPEQWEGRPVPASDQYALAIMAFLLLTGRAPFRGTPGQVMQQHFHALPPAPCTINPRLSPAVDAVLLRALAKQPQERFPSVLQFAQALEQAFQQREIPPVPLPGNPLPQAEEYSSLSTMGQAIAPRTPQQGIVSVQTVEQSTSAPLEDTVKTPVYIAPEQSYGTSDSASNQDTFVMKASERLTGKPPFLEAPVKIEIQLPPARRMVLPVFALLTIASSLFAYFALVVPSGQLQATHQATVNATATTQARTAATAQARQTATALSHIIVTAYSRGKPQLLWTFATGDQIWSSPTVVNGTIYVGSNDHKLYAIDAATGRQKWSFTARHEVRATPRVVNGVVYIGSIDSKLYAIDAATGRQKWAFATGSGVPSSPMVVNGIVYVSSGTGKLYAVDAATGRQKWVFTAGGSIWSSLTVANGVVYVGSVDKRLYALDAVSGQQKWSFATRDMIEDSSPAVVKGVVYIGSDDRKLYALDAVSGQQKWSFATGGALQSSPAVADGAVFVGSADHKLYAVNAATGHQKWIFTTGGAIHSSPTVLNGIVYVGSSDGKLYAVDTDTGHQMWTFATGGSIRDSLPAIVNGVLYVGSDDHKLYAIAIPFAHRPTSYEAEAPANVLTGTAGVYGCTRCSQGKYVAYVGKGSTGDLSQNGTLTFYMNTSYTGLHLLIIYYVNATRQRFAFMSIDGNPGIRVIFPTTSNIWGIDSTVGFVKVYAHLKRGRNTIEFYNDQEAAPNFDRIVII
jgi:eukaryotic-like serine/threonine-protein kinase